MMINTVLMTVSEKEAWAKAVDKSVLMAQTIQENVELVRQFPSTFWTITLETINKLNASDSWTDRGRYGGAADAALNQLFLKSDKELVKKISEAWHRDREDVIRILIERARSDLLIPFLEKIDVIQAKNMLSGGLDTLMRKPADLSAEEGARRQELLDFSVKVEAIPKGVKRANQALGVGDCALGLALRNPSALTVKELFVDYPRFPIESWNAVEPAIVKAFEKYECNENAQRGINDLYGLSMMLFVCQTADPAVTERYIQLGLKNPKRLSRVNQDPSGWRAIIATLSSHNQEEPLVSVLHALQSQDLAFVQYVENTGAQWRMRNAITGWDPTSKIKEYFQGLSLCTEAVLSGATAQTVHLLKEFGFPIPDCHTIDEALNQGKGMGNWAGAQSARSVCESLELEESALLTENRKPKKLRF